MNRTMNLICAALALFGLQSAAAQTVQADGNEARALLLRKADLVAKTPDRSGPGVKVWTMRRQGTARTNMVEFSGRSPLHLHPDADHTLLVVEGSVWVRAGDGEYKLGVGDYISIPPKMPHTYWVDSGTKALLVSFDAPAYDEARTVFLEGERR